MPAKQSLAEKYALRQTQSFSHNQPSRDIVLGLYSPASIKRPILDSPQTNVYRKARSPRKLLAEKYESRNHKKHGVLELPGTFGLPIKTGHASLQQAVEFAPPQLFKSAAKTHISPQSNNIWASADAKSYRVAKRASTGSRVGQLARQITNYIASFTNRRAEKTDNVDKAKIHKIPEISKATPNFVPPAKYPSPMDSFFRFRSEPKEKAAAPRPQVEPDYDEVDLVIREKKHKQEQMQLEEEKRQLERRLSAEHRSKQELKEEYERKLYLQQQDFEAQMHTIREQSREMAAAPRLPVSEGASDRTFVSDSSRDESWILRHSFLRLELAERTRMLAEQAAASAQFEKEAGLSHVVNTENFNAALGLENGTLGLNARGNTELQLALFTPAPAPAPASAPNVSNVSNDHKMAEAAEGTDLAEPNHQPPSQNPQDPFNTTAASSFFLESHVANEPTDTIHVIDRTLRVAMAAPFSDEPHVKHKVRVLRHWRNALAGDTPDNAPSQIREQLIKTLRHLDLFECQYAQNPRRALVTYSDFNLDSLHALLRKHRTLHLRKLGPRTQKAQELDRKIVDMGPPETYIQTSHDFAKYIGVVMHKAKAMLAILERARVDRESERVIHAISRVRDAIAALRDAN